jgi:Holliday junction resolvase-like predicted endonuclease
VSNGANDNFRPEDNLHTWKLQRLGRTIQIYLSEKSVSDETEWQFDVITVYIDKKRLISKIEIIENVIL